MKTLILYYSRTGVTKKVAEILKEKLGAELETVVDTVNRQGVLGYLKSGKEATLKISPEISPLVNQPENFDLVIVGTPVWAFTMASPVRTMLERYKGQIKRAAFFRTQGGAGSEKTFPQMAEILGQSPVAELVLLTKEVASGQAMEKMEKFVQALK